MVSQNSDPSNRPRRFYKTVDVAPSGPGFAVRLDGRTPKSPAGHPLLLPTQALAQLSAAEWDAQAEQIQSTKMLATRWAWTALDRAPTHRAEMVEEVVRYAETDQLCYFADGPTSLVERQERRWGPMLDWAASTLGVHFHRAQGIGFRPQPPETLEEIRKLAAALDDFDLTGLNAAAALFGSAILAFALQRGAITAEAAFDLGRLEEDFQEERWGVDAEAQDRADKQAVEAVLLERWFRARNDNS